MSIEIRRPSESCSGGGGGERRLIERLENICYLIVIMIIVIVIVTVTVTMAVNIITTTP